jgi:hypothetical protein
VRMLKRTTREREREREMFLRHKPFLVFKADIINVVRCKAPIMRGLTLRKSAIISAASGSISIKNPFRGSNRLLFLALA